MAIRKTFAEPLPKNLSPPASGICTVIEAGNTMEVVTVQNPQGNLANYRRISGSSYVDDSTGELKHYTPRKHNSGDYHLFKRSYDELRRTILTNFTGSSSELYITLTVDSKFSADLTSLHEYFRSFWKRFHYRYPDSEYVVIAEPHKSGRFHFHALVLNTSGEMFFIPNEDVYALWQVGFTKTAHINDVDKLASYFCTKEKQMRWSEFYCRGHRLFRCSHGIRRPSKSKMTREEVDCYAEQKGFRRYSGYTCYIQQECDDGTSRTLNVITHERFRR